MVSFLFVVCGLVGASFVSGTPHASFQKRSSSAFPLNPGFKIQNVAALAKSIPSHSWEYGVATEALFELYTPGISVFGSHPFPIPTLNPDDVPALSYAQEKIVIGTGKDGLSPGAGAVGDPASLAVGAILLGKTNKTFADAAAAQMDYVINEAPRYSNGAISQRADVGELWADFVYMAPPSMAYYAVLTRNESLLQETVRQCGLYRQVLQAQLDPSVPYRGVWHHIIGPQSQDLGLWSTGNSWSAGGMARVLATVMKAPILHGANPSWRLKGIQDLETWIQEILDGAMGAPMDQGLLRNYLDDTTDGHGFGEISGSTMLASVAYRMAVIAPHRFGSKYVKWADGIRTVIGGNDTAGNPHVTDTGVVTPAVNPLGWGDTNPFTTGSPEGQNFVVLMYTAWRDCVFTGICKLLTKKP